MIGRDRRGGSLYIERMIGGRRFRRATGLPDTPRGRKTAVLYDGMIDTLLAAGRTDLVRGLSEKTLSFSDIWPHYRRGQWERVPSPEHLRPCFPLEKAEALGAVGQWIPQARRMNGLPISARHRRDLVLSFRALARLQPAATIADLPRLLARYRVQCERQGYGRTFNKARAHCQAFVRETCGKRRGVLWSEVTDVAMLPVQRTVSPPQTVEQARALAAKLPRQHAAIWWGMCVTGMGPDEFWRVWQDAGTHIHIEGTKRPGRVRNIPRVECVVPPARGPLAFARALKLATGGTVTPYAARRSFAHWLEQAGIPRTRIEMYLGHGKRSVTDLYLWHEVAPYLAADTKRLRKVLGIKTSPENSPEAVVTPLRKYVWALLDSNQRPTDYESHSAPLHSAPQSVVAPHPRGESTTAPHSITRTSPENSPEGG